MTMVSPASKVHEAGEPTMSLETIGSSVYSSTRSSGGLAAASAKAALTSATDGLPCTTAVKSVMEPAGSGTRSEYAVEAALHGRQHQAGGPGRAGRGRARCWSPPARARRRSLCGEVEQVLVVGVGVHRGHEPAHDVERVVDHLDHGDEAVRRARGVGDDDVLLGVEVVVVDADDEGGVGVARRGRDDDPLHRAAQVAGGVGPAGEDARWTRSTTSTPSSSQGSCSGRARP